MARIQNSKHLVKERQIQRCLRRKSKSELKKNMERAKNESSFYTSLKTLQTVRKNLLIFQLTHPPFLITYQFSHSNNFLPCQDLNRSIHLMRYIFMLTLVTTETVFVITCQHEERCFWAWVYWGRKFVPRTDAMGVLTACLYILSFA